MVSVIVTAAGNSSRMGIDKMLIDFFGKTTLERSIEPFEETDEVFEIIVTANEKNIEEYNKIIKQHGFNKVRAVLKGGKNRTESVKKALENVSKDANFIAVHDGARPLIDKETIKKAIDEAKRYGAAAVGVRETETLKEIDNDMFIKRTIDRENVLRIRTPQIFRKDILLEAYKDCESMSDDCALCEKNGITIKVVECSSTNIKLTTKDDIEMVKAIIKGRENA